MANIPDPVRINFRIEVDNEPVSIVKSGRKPAKRKQRYEIRPSEPRPCASDCKCFEIGYEAGYRSGQQVGQAQSLGGYDNGYADGLEAAGLADADD